jgi:hypothetical protein
VQRGVELAPAAHMIGAQLGAVFVGMRRWHGNLGCDFGAELTAGAARAARNS